MYVQIYSKPLFLIIKAHYSFIRKEIFYIKKLYMSLMSMPAKFVVFKDTSGQFRFRLIAPNNEIIAASEAYTTKDACMNGIESVKTNAPVAEIEDQTEE